MIFFHNDWAWNPKHLSRLVRKPFFFLHIFAYAKTKTQISFAVTAKLISAFVFATRIVQSLYFLNPKFHASSHLLWLYSPVCVGPGRKPQRLFFSERGSFFKLKPICHVSCINTWLISCVDQERLRLVHIFENSK